MHLCSATQQIPRHSHTFSNIQSLLNNCAGLPTVFFYWCVSLLFFHMPHPHGQFPFYKHIPSCHINPKVPMKPLNRFFSQTQTASLRSTCLLPLLQNFLQTGKKQVPFHPPLYAMLSTSIPAHNHLKPNLHLICQNHSQRSLNPTLPFQERGFFQSTFSVSLTTITTPPPPSHHPSPTPPPAFPYPLLPDLTSSPPPPPVFKASISIGCRETGNLESRLQPRAGWLVHIWGRLGKELPH